MGKLQILLSLLEGFIGEILYLLTFLFFVLNGLVMGSLMLLVWGSCILLHCLIIVFLCLTFFLLMIFFLLVEASIEQACVISSVFYSFYCSSGSKVKNSKTLIYFFKNVGDSEANAISGLLGYSITKDLGKYLGVPLQHSKVSSCMHQEIIDKVEKRLSGWTASHLSLEAVLLWLSRFFKPSSST